MTTNRKKATRHSRTRNAPLGLLLVAMRLFNLDDKTALTWLASSHATIDDATSQMMMTNSPDAPYGAIMNAVRDEHGKDTKAIDAQLKALGADISLQDAIDGRTEGVAESAVWRGFLLGWTLRGRMDEQDGAR